MHPSNDALDCHTDCLRPVPQELEVTTAKWMETASNVQLSAEDSEDPLKQDQSKF